MFSPKMPLGKRRKWIRRKSAPFSQGSGVTVDLMTEFAKDVV